jgi:hypothetical protein
LAKPEGGKEIIHDLTVQMKIAEKEDDDEYLAERKAKQKDPNEVTKAKHAFVPILKPVIQENHIELLKLANTVAMHNIKLEL